MMGCWNETCALTRTPIAPGDPVVRLRVDGRFNFWGRPLGLQNSIFGGPTRWALSLDRGEYNDYGGIDQGVQFDIFASQQFEDGGSSYYIDLRFVDPVYFFHAGLWDRIASEFPVNPERDYMAESPSKPTLANYSAWESEKRGKERQRWNDSLDRRNAWAVENGKDTQAHTPNQARFNDAQWETFWEKTVTAQPRQLRLLTPEEAQAVLAVCAFADYTRQDILSANKWQGRQSGWNADEERSWDVLLEETRKYKEQFFKAEDD